MKILGISGGFKNGNNDAMCREALIGAKEKGAEIEFINLHDLNLKPCTGCIACVAGPNGIMNGGNGECVIKDDFLWLNDKYLEADGVIFVMPIFEKGVPGVFKLIQDRIAGPGHDTGMLIVSKQIAEKKGTKGPDPRNFKKRFATYIGIGASNWTCRMHADMKLFGMTSMLQCVDSLTFSWSKAIVMQDEKLARIREAGRSIANAAANPDNYKYMGSPGVCPHCHTSMFVLNEDGLRAECSVCSSVGELKIVDGKYKFEFDPGQIKHAHDTIEGKFEHMDDVSKLETEFFELKKTDEFKKRKEAYKAFIQHSVPNK